MFLFLPAVASGQPGGQPLHGDCSAPIELRINREYIYGESPSGPGNLQEFSGNQGRVHLFPSEINTVWYRFTAPAGGKIIFDIHPFRAEDDYDWMLFRETGTNYCDSILNYRVKPLRSNRARNDLKIESNTGLREAYENLHAPPGPGKSYSKPIAVKRGDTYLLVLDNIYPGGEGHRIIIKYEGTAGVDPVSIKGKIIDKITRRPLSAKIYAEEDSTSYPLLETLTDSVSAGFTLDAPGNTAIHLAALKEGYLMATLNLTTGLRDTALVLELEPAEKGGKMVLFNIRFLPNKAQFQPGSVSELDRLFEFMQQSAGKYIRITGHTNSNVFTSKSWLLDLSVYRAAAVRDYLTGRGIDPARIRIAGAGGSRPLTTSSEMKEAMKNLRVEIELLN